MLSLTTRLRKTEINSFVSEERKLYHNPRMSPMPVFLKVGKAKKSTRGQKAKGGDRGQ